MRSSDTANGPTIRRLRGKVLAVYAEHWWYRSTRCAGGDCLLAARELDTVYVWDSKLGGDSPVQEWPLNEWRFLVDAVELGIHYTGFRLVDDGNVRLGWARLGHDPLTFTPVEWEKFVADVRAGKFDPDVLSSRFQSSSSGDHDAAEEERVGAGRGGAVSAQNAATGAVSEYAEGSAVPVAADLAPTGSDDRYWFGTITVPPAGRVLSISEVDAIVTTGQPGPETGPPPVKPPFYGISAARRDHDPASLLTASRVLPEAAHTDSSAPAVEEGGPVTGDRSEAGTGSSPDPVPAARPSETPIYGGRLDEPIAARVSDIADDLPAAAQPTLDPLTVIAAQIEQEIRTADRQAERESSDHNDDGASYWYGYGTALEWVLRLLGDEWPHVRDGRAEYRVALAAAGEVWANQANPIDDAEADELLRQAAAPLVPTDGAS